MNAKNDFLKVRFIFLSVRELFKAISNSAIFYKLFTLLLVIFSSYANIVIAVHWKTITTTTKKDIQNMEEKQNKTKRYPAYLYYDVFGDCLIKACMLWQWVWTLTLLWLKWYAHKVGTWIYDFCELEDSGYSNPSKSVKPLHKPDWYSLSCKPLRAQD